MTPTRPLLKRSLLASVCLFFGLSAPGHAAEGFSSQVQSSAKAATVRITDRAPWHCAVGSGILLGRDSESVWVLTACHVVTPGQDLTVEYFRAADGQGVPLRGPVEVVGRDHAADLALLQVRTTQTVPAPLRLCPPGFGPGGDEPALYVGCVAGGEPTSTVARLHGMVTQHRAPFWLVNPEPRQGQSGGPLVTRDGFLIGVCSAGGGGLGLFGSLERIRALCGRVGVDASDRLASAARRPAPSWPDTGARPEVGIRPLPAPAPEAGIQIIRQGTIVIHASPDGSHSVSVEQGTITIRASSSGTQTIVTIRSGGP